MDGVLILIIGGEFIKYIITSDNKTLDEYYKYYFKKYPKRKKKPIDKPFHPSLNVWIIKPRIQMNAMKQSWKEYTMWLVKKYGYEGLNIEKCEITVKTYMPTKRRADTDNTTPKFVLDSLVESGVIVDDSYTCLNPLHLWLGYDKDNPRMEVIIETK